VDQKPGVARRGGNKRSGGEETLQTPARPFRISRGKPGVARILHELGILERKEVRCMASCGSVEIISLDALKLEKQIAHPATI
jgi:hypothetical protein